jgi:hypothetical protein
MNSGSYVADSQEVPRPQELDRQLRSVLEISLLRTASKAGIRINPAGLTIVSNGKGFAAVAFREDVTPFASEEMAKGARIGVLFLSAEVKVTGSTPRIPAGSYVLQLPETGAKRRHAELLLLDDTGQLVASLHGKVGKTSTPIPGPRIRFGGCDYTFHLNSWSICLYRFCQAAHGFSLSTWCVGFDD